MYDFMKTNLPVCQDPVTKRWFISMGQPGFNCWTNNTTGWTDRATALKTRDLYAAKAK